MTGMVGAKWSGALSAALVSGFGDSPAQAANGARAGSGPLRSAGVLAFGPDNVLFGGDIAGAAVHAFALRETDLTPQHASSLATSRTSKVGTLSAA